MKKTKSLLVANDKAVSPSLSWRARSMSGSDNSSSKLIITDGPTKGGPTVFVLGNFFWVYRTRRRQIQQTTDDVDLSMPAGPTEDMPAAIIDTANICAVCDQSFGYFGTPGHDGIHEGRTAPVRRVICRRPISEKQVNHIAVTMFSRHNDCA